MTDEERMAYIDSELARRRFEGAQAQIQSQFQQAPRILRPVADEEPQDGRKESQVERQPAILGRLHEIDLGDEVKSKNIKRTEWATRRLNGEPVMEDLNESKKPEKVRLGRDGKPWRGRKRRGSEDVKRDQLVEEVLRENRCKSLFLLISKVGLLSIHSGDIRGASCGVSSH